MADAKDLRDEQSNRASERLAIGLQSCRKVIDRYRSVLAAAENRVDGVPGATKAGLASEASADGG